MAPHVTYQVTMSGNGYVSVAGWEGASALLLGYPAGIPWKVGSIPSNYDCLHNAGLYGYVTTIAGQLEDWRRLAVPALWLPFPSLLPGAVLAIIVYSIPPGWSWGLYRYYSV